MDFSRAMASFLRTIKLSTVVSMKYSLVRVKHQSNKYKQTNTWNPWAREQLSDLQDTMSLDTHSFYTSQLLSPGFTQNINFWFIFFPTVTPWVFLETLWNKPWVWTANHRLTSSQVLIGCVSLQCYHVVVSLWHNLSWSEPQGIQQCSILSWHLWTGPSFTKHTLITIQWTTLQVHLLQIYFV